MALRIPPKHSSASTPSGGSPHAFRQLLYSKASGNGFDNFWVVTNIFNRFEKKNQAIFYFRNHRKKDEIQFKEFLRYYPSKIDLRTVGQSARLPRVHLKKSSKRSTKQRAQAKIFAVSRFLAIWCILQVIFFPFLECCAK